MNIFVSNIPFRASEQELKGLFEQYGSVDSAKIIIDKFTRKSKGFGFVEMSSDDEANNAISQLNGFEFMGKNLVVAIARPKTENRDRFPRRDDR